MKVRQSYEKDFYAPMPTEFTTKMRTNIFWQFYRFLVINFKMIRMTTISLELYIRLFKLLNITALQKTKLLK
jgi:hypothetical protein